MDTSLVGAASGILGLLVGLSARFVTRLSEKQQQDAGDAPEASPLPAGAGEVLSVLRSSAIVVDRSHVVVRATPATVQMGLVKGDRVVHEDVLAMVAATLRDGGIRTLELELTRAPLGGETLAVHVRVAPLGAELVLVLVEDHTEQRRLDAMRRDFVANVSHELKTPVGALSLLAEAILDATDDPEAVRRFAGRMQYESQRLANLVSELIDLSRLQDQDVIGTATQVKVDTVVSDALDRCRLSAEAKEISLVHGGASGLVVRGDAEALTKALRNLVHNAIAYSPERTRVAVGVRRAADLVEISVTDQGIGIPERDLERIFERFYRIDPARSRATGGTGLGLSIVKHVAATHGGEVKVWSVEGAGSTFTLRLPLDVDGPHGSSPSPPSFAPTTGATVPAHKEALR